MKRLGGLLYWDIILLLLLLRQGMIILSIYIGQLKVLNIFFFSIITLLLILNIIYGDKGKSERYSKMTEKDARIWRIFQCILYAGGACYFLFIRPKFSMTIQLIAFIFFILSILSYFGVQIYFLRTKKW